jgi:hypothetical protein
MTHCPDVRLTNDVHAEYTRAVNDARRERFKGSDHPDLRAALARVTAASEKFQHCIRDMGHEAPHRDADGVEWGHPVEEPETIDLPDVEVLAGWLREMPEAYDNHDAAPEMTTSIDVDVDTLAERIIKHLREEM